MARRRERKVRRILSEEKVADGPAGWNPLFTHIREVEALPLIAQRVSTAGKIFP
jgi:hypothetical protein